MNVQETSDYGVDSAPVPASAPIEEKIGARLFHEFRAKFSELKEDNAEIRLILAGVGASVAVTQERIEERLKDIAIALRESVIAISQIDELRGQVMGIEIELKTKRDSILYLENRLESLYIDLKEERTKTKKGDILIKVIGVIIVSQTILLISHLF